MTDRTRCRSERCTLSWRRTAFFRQEAREMLHHGSNRVGASFALCVWLIFALGIYSVVRIGGTFIHTVPAYSISVGEQMLLYSILLFFAVAPLLPGIYRYYTVLYLTSQRGGGADFCDVFYYYETRRRLFTAYLLVLFFLIRLPVLRTGNLFYVAVLHPGWNAEQILSESRRQMKHRYGLTAMLLPMQIPRLAVGLLLFGIPLLVNGLPLYLFSHISACSYLETTA